MSDEGWNQYYGLIAAAIREVDETRLGNAFIEKIQVERSIRDQAKGSLGYVFYVRPFARPSGFEVHDIKS
jgi:hypothetical protein